MKKNSILYTFILGSMLVGLTNCNKKTTIRETDNKAGVSTGLKAGTAGGEIAFAQKEVNSDFEKFVREAEEKIQISGQNILQLKLRPLENKTTSRNEYLVRIGDLEKRNNVLKGELDSYILKGNGNWHSFRQELYKGLNKLNIECDEVLLAQMK